MNGLRSIAAIAALSAGLGYDYGGSGMLSYPSKRDWSHIKHTYTPKPLSKRAKRRLRGKARGQS